MRGYRTSLKNYRIITNGNINIFVRAKNREEALHKSGFRCRDLESKRVKVIRI